MRQKLYSTIIGSLENDLLLFLHGVGTASSCWWQQIEAFKKEYAVLLVDLPGHGKSVHIPWESMTKTVDLVAETIPEGKEAHLVGISLGGHVALDLAKTYPKKTHSVYISGITTKPMGPKIFKGLLPIYLKRIEKLQQNETKLQKFFVEMGVPYEKVEAFISEYQKVSSETFRAIFEDLYSFKLDNSHSLINTPILFAACEYEERGIQQTLEYAPTILPQANTTFIKGAHHQWPIQKPQLFNQAIENWLREVEQSMDN